MVANGLRSSSSNTTLLAELERGEIGCLGNGQAASWGDYPIDSLRIRSETCTVHDVLKKIERKAYLIDPDFHSDFIWDENKQSRLIESVVMRIPLPAFYLAEDDLGRAVVVDGLQRLTILQRFVNNEFSLRLGHRPELTSKNFLDLPPKLQNRVEECNLTLHVIDEKVPEQVRLGVLERVNGSVPLSRQQMRNCLYMGEATRFLKKEARSKAFRRAIGGGLNVTTMRDREFVNRFCAFQMLDLEKYRNMDQFLADGLREMNARPEVLPDLSFQLRTALDNNFSLFGRHAFRRQMPTRARRSVLNASLWDVMSTGLSRYPREIVEENSSFVREALCQLIGNQHFIDAIARDPSSANQVKRRFAMAAEMFLEVFGACPD